MWPAAVATANESATRTAIPAGSRILRISAHGSLKRQQPKQRVLYLTSAKKIDEVVELLNALPARRPGMTRCPLDFGIRVRLAFYTSRASPPSAVAEVDPQGCGIVELTIGGKSQPALEGGSLLIQRIDHMLGVKLNVGPILHGTPSCAMMNACTTRVDSSNNHYILFRLPIQNPLPSSGACSCRQQHPTIAGHGDPAPERMGARRPTRTISQHRPRTSKPPKPLHPPDHRADLVLP